MKQNIVLLLFLFGIICSCETPESKKCIATQELNNNSDYDKTVTITHQLGTDVFFVPANSSKTITIEIHEDYSFQDVDITYLDKDGKQHSEFKLFGLECGNNLGVVYI